MVARVWGEVQGQEIVFSRDGTTNRWVVAVPVSLTGIYIIALWAADAAGNTSYAATIKAVFDSSHLCTSIYVLDVGVRFRGRDGISWALDTGSVQTDLTGEPLGWIYRRECIQTKILRCEVCGQ